MSKDAWEALATLGGFALIAVGVGIAWFFYYLGRAHYAKALGEYGLQETSEDD